MSDTGQLKVLFSPMAAILLPAGQGALFGVGVSVTVGSLAWTMHAENPLAVAGLAGGLAFGAGVLIGLDWWKRQVEAVNAPAPAPVTYPLDTIRVMMTAADPAGAFATGAFMDLPTDRARLVKLCQKLATGADFSLSSFGGRGKIYSRAEFESLRDALIERGMAYWRSPHSHSQGAALGGAGKAFARYVATLDPDPYPDLPYPAHLVDARGNVIRA